MPQRPRAEQGNPFERWECFGTWGSMMWVIKAENTLSYRPGWLNLCRGRLWAVLVLVTVSTRSLCFTLKTKKITQKLCAVSQTRQWEPSLLSTSWWSPWMCWWSVGPRWSWTAQLTVRAPPGSSGKRTALSSTWCRTTAASCCPMDLYWLTVWCIPSTINLMKDITSVWPLWTAWEPSWAGQQSSPWQVRLCLTVAENVVMGRNALPLGKREGASQGGTQQLVPAGKLGLWLSFYWLAVVVCSAPVSSSMWGISKESWNEWIKRSVRCLKSQWRFTTA